MPLLSSTILTTYDLGRRLQFRVTRERGQLEYLVSIVVIAMFFWQTFRYRTLFFIAGSLLAIMAFIANTVHGNTTELDISADELTVHGNFGRLFSNKVQLTMRSILDFSFEPEFEDQQQGLYARTSNTKFCIVPGINEYKAMEVRNLILTRFHELVEQMSMNISIFGKNSDPIILGLSKKG